VGRLSEEKGCHHLIEAFQRADTRACELVFAGDATYASDYATHLRAVAGENVRFLGWVDQGGLADLYANCALFVLPSSVEGLSVALLEAMSHGAAVLTSDIAPNIEAIGDAGWVFREGDVADLAAKLSALLSNRAVLRNMGARAEARVAKHYTWEAVVEQLEEVYDSLFPRGPLTPVDSS
jgi:glycosyltransferase involved in cell wall biosynthesis